jgi:transposase-like protein
MRDNYYIPQPKRYSEEEKKEALQLLIAGNSGRKVGKILGMNKSNTYRWAIEAEKKEKAGMEKPYTKANSRF